MAANKTLELSIKIAGKVDRSLISAINSAQSNISSLSQTMSKIGTAGLAAMGAMAAGTAAAIVSCTNEAAAFENQMSDVVKYVDGLADTGGKISESIWAVEDGGNGKAFAENYTVMKDAILDLSAQIPYTAEDLTRLAAAAGQSDKSMEEITGGFLKDAAMWGAAMDISADQAGDWAAKWEMAFDKDHDQIMTLANQINYLGANNATTAAEIAQVVNDAASLGQAAGIDPDATAAMGTAMLAMGVDAGKAATSIKRIYTQVSKGASATKAMKMQWQELGFTAEGVAKSMQEDGVGTMEEIFRAISQLPEERQVAALSTLFGQWAIEGGAKIVGNLKYYADVMDSVTNPENYKGSMAKEFQIKADTPEAVRMMRDSAFRQLKIGFGENFLPVQKEIDTAMRDLFVRLNENMPQLSQLAGTLAELASGGITKLGDALETALPYVQTALDYVAGHGPQVTKILGGLAGTFAAMKFAPGMESVVRSAGGLLLGTPVAGTAGAAAAGRTGGLLGAVMGLFRGGQNAASTAGTVLTHISNNVGAAASGANSGIGGRLANGAAGAIVTLQNIRGLLSGNPRTASDAQSIISTAIIDTQLNGVGAMIRNMVGIAAGQTGAGQYFGGIGSSFANLMNTDIGTGVAGALSAAGNTTAQIFGGISQAAGLTGLANRAAGLAGSGAGWVTGKAGTLAAAITGSAPVQAIGGVAGRVMPVVGGALGNAGQFAGAGLGLMNSVTGFGSLFAGAAPVIAAVSGIIAVVSILGDHLEDIRGIVGNIFGDKGVAVFDSFTGKLSDIGGFIQGLFNGGVADALVPLQERITGMFGDNFGAAFGGLTQILQSIMGVAGQVVSFATGTVKPIIQDVFSFITGTVFPVILQTFTAAAPTIASIISNIGSAVMSGMQIIGTAIQTVLPIILGMINVILNIASVVIPALLAGYEVFSSGLASIAVSVQGIFQGVIDFVVNVFTGNWSQAWENVKQIFGNAFSALAELIKTPLNAVIAIVNKAISGINSINITLPEWGILGDLAGKSFAPSIPEIPMLAKGGFTSGPSIAGEAGTEAVISFQSGARASNIALWEKAGQMLGVEPVLAEVSNPAAELLDCSIRDSGGPITVNYSPTIIIQGNANRSDIDAALRDDKARFKAWYEELKRNERRVRY